MLIVSERCNCRTAFHNVPEASWTGWARSGLIQQPIDENDNQVFLSLLLFLHHVLWHEEHSHGLLWAVWLDFPYIPCLHRGFVLYLLVARPHVDQGLPPVEIRHAGSLRLRLTIVGRHARLQGCGACFLFFPRSVGLRPTSSSAIGAFIMAPSMLCHCHEIPSISSYSASPARQRERKKPAFIQREKYPWIELGLPKRSFGKAFHWQPVRKT